MFLSVRHGGISSYHWTFSQHHAEACRGEGKYPKASTYARVPKIPPASPGSMALLLQALDYFPKIKDTQPFMEFLVISFLRGWFTSVELDKHTGEGEKNCCKYTDVPTCHFDNQTSTELLLNDHCYTPSLVANWTSSGHLSSSVYFLGYWSNSLNPHTGLWVHMWRSPLGIGTGFQSRYQR